MSHLAIQYVNKLASLVLKENVPNLNHESFWARAVERMEREGHSNGDHHTLHVHHHFHEPLVIKTDTPPDDFRLIHQKLDIIMSQLADLIAAATTASTAADALSVKTDTLIVKVEAVITALQGVQLPPEGEKALADLKKAAAGSAAAGAAVDAEVAHLDTVLPTPAPAAPTEP